MKIIVSLLSTASLCQNPLTSSFQQNNLTNSDLSQGFTAIKNNSPTLKGKTPAT